MKVKTSELTGLPLRYATAVALGGTDLWYDDINTWWIKLDGEDRTLQPGWSEKQSFLPDTDGKLGMEIIDREGISIVRQDPPADNWWAFLPKQAPVDAFGPTPLIAIWRCFVTSKLGKEVDIPEELLK